MPYTGGPARQTLFGRPPGRVAEPLRPHLEVQLIDPTTFKEVHWTCPSGVLDQEDLTKQGIDTSQLVPGAPQVDALGSCVFNATSASYSERRKAAGQPDLFSPGDTKAYEEFAIKLYARTSHRTGNPSTEWPPTDCGSTGQEVCQELETEGDIVSYRTGTTPLQSLALLQNGTVIEGGPWWNSWMQPDADGFVDGDGSYEAWMAARESGVAGGHERCQVQLAQLGLVKHLSGSHPLVVGGVDLRKTVIGVQNSWAAAWCKGGFFYVHASTLYFEQSVRDYKQFVLKEASA